MLEGYAYYLDEYENKFVQVDNYEKWMLQKEKSHPFLYTPARSKSCDLLIGQVQNSSKFKPILEF